MALEKGGEGSKQAAQFVVIEELFLADLMLGPRKNLTDICKKIYFGQDNNNQLMFANKDVLITYDYIDRKMDILFDFENLDC